MLNVLNYVLFFTPQVRIVCISDTHCKTKNLVLPPGDILLHSGDFTARGKIEEVQAFAKFIGRFTL